MMGYAPIRGQGSRMSETAFQSRSKSIGELLGSNERARLIVPPFQRPYSWEKKHIESFWADLVDFFNDLNGPKPRDKYFLGPIVTLTKSKDEIEILDGQQRLATATIFFCVLRDVARGFQFVGAGDFA